MGIDSVSVRILNSYPPAGPPAGGSFGGNKNEKTTARPRRCTYDGNCRVQQQSAGEAPQPDLQNRLEAIQQAGKLTICTSPDYAPMNL
jgi:hypothetical protein